jgi:thiol-disulfide isomerase/thioredoxin
MHRTLVALALAAGLLGSGCSSKSEKQKDTGLATDTVESDFTTALDDGGSTCGAGIYPCGPYGTKQGQVATNMQFLGFEDPKTQCKADKDQVIDTSKLVKISFKDFFLGDTGSGCSTYKKKLLWVMVSAGWCGPCKSEVQSTSQEYAAGNVDSRVGLMNIVFETAAPVAPADETFLKQWVSTFSLNFPTVIDPSFKMGAFFVKSAVPFNMLIDLSNMKIFYEQTGANLPGLGAKITEFFSG